MKQLLLICGVCLLSLSAFTQTIQNLNATFSDGKVIVVYDLLGSKPGETYSLGLYCSHNNFSAPVKNVIGDVGNNISTGFGKKIIWDAAIELGTFSGQVSFKVMGEMNHLPITFIAPQSGRSASRGKSMNILWEGGRPDQNVTLEVFNGNEQVSEIGQTKNSGRYAWSIPKDFDKGTYSIKLTSGQEVIQSESFAIKSKVPMLVKIIPIVVVGVLAATYDWGGNKKTDNKLPTAPDPQ